MLDQETVHSFEDIKHFLRPGDRVLFYKPHQSFGFTIDTDQNLGIVHDLLERDLGLKRDAIKQTICNHDGSQIIARIEHWVEVNPVTKHGNALISILTADI
ncbi:hypothetical protein [Methylobacterium durans]|uniref:Uncharacterized protein n=1 Tax=Methylobacterium durans TaxID=2202825 RepID=A0A2U8W6R2_9HYPH|nr:hypothetical protein [Methylobacterium durans]AWN41767.1 hypothetical protein DK389_16235 [Methylobacterium durans]